MMAFDPYGDAVARHHQDKVVARDTYFNAPPLDLAIVGAVFDEAEGPLYMVEIGAALGIAVQEDNRCTGWWLATRNARGWDNHRHLVEYVGELRDLGRVVKLPHEGKRIGAKYVRCDSPEHGTRLQLEVCEEALAKLDRKRAARGGSESTATRRARRALMQVLEGLRHQVKR